MLIITTTEKSDTGNPHHTSELNRIEFGELLNEYFKDVQILYQKGLNHRQEITTFMTGICRKED